MKKGNLIVVSGPSGVGKGTICNRILEKEKKIVYSISMTSRKPRNMEKNGVNYFFVTNEEFEEHIKNDDFLEYAKVHQNYYGTPKKKVIENLEKGYDVLLEIDVQGALQVKQKYDKAILIFVLPPSLKELENRIISRNTETKEIIDLRMKNAKKELDLIKMYDYFIINDNLDEAIQNFESILFALKLKVYEDIKEDFKEIF